MKHGTPDTLDQMLDQLELGTETRRLVKAAIRDFIGNKLTKYSMSENEIEADKAMAIYRDLMKEAA